MVVTRNRKSARSKRRERRTRKAEEETWQEPSLAD
jgi:hypothetical protein